MNNSKRNTKWIINSATIIVCNNNNTESIKYLIIKKLVRKNKHDRGIDMH